MSNRVWIDSCADMLIAMNPESPLDATDWDCIAEDLHEDLHPLPPKFVAASYVHLMVAADRLCGDAESPDGPYSGE